jgi:arginase
MIVFFPQWQGTGAWTAIADGCRMIAEHVDRAPGAEDAAFVPVLLDPHLPDEATDRPRVVGREALLEQRRLADRLIRRAWEANSREGHPTILVGGDCSVTPALVGVAAEAFEGALQVVWIDAHADLNTAHGSPSGHAHGMALRLCLGEGCPGLDNRDAPVRPERVTLVGTRAFDEDEWAFVDRHRIPVIAPDAPERIAAAVAMRLTGEDPVHLHIDLDCLDPAVFPHVNYPVPGGLSLDAVMAILEAVQDRAMVAGVTLTEYAPKEAQGGIGAIRRILGEGLGVGLAPAPER